MLRILQFGEERFHFGLGVSVAGFGGGGYALVQDGTRFIRSRLLGEQLAEHLVARNIAGITLNEFAKLGFGAGSVRRIQVLEREAVAGKGVVGFLCHKRLEHFAA